MEVAHQTVKMVQALHIRRVPSSILLVDFYLIGSKSGLLCILWRHSNTPV
jgi:hypothetical protein